MSPLYKNVSMRLSDVIMYHTCIYTCMNVLVAIILSSMSEAFCKICGEQVWTASDDAGHAIVTTQLHYPATVRRQLTSLIPRPSCGMI